MILVTTGSTMPFDELLQEVDNLAGAGFFDTDVVCQHGQAAYRVKHCTAFMYLPSDEFTQLLARSSMVITHGGATVVQVLMARKPFIAFPNPRGAGDHQTKFLQQLAAVVDISWASDVAEMARLFAERRAKGPATVHLNYPRAHDLILNMIADPNVLPTEQ